MNKIITQNYRGGRPNLNNTMKEQYGDLPVLVGSLISEVHQGLSFPITIDEETDESIDVGVLVKAGRAEPFFFTSSDVDGHFTNLGELDFYSPAVLDTHLLDKIQQEFDTAAKTCKSLSSLAQTIETHPNSLPSDRIQIQQVGVTLHIGS